MKFKVGDRVIGIGEVDGLDINNKTGQIYDINTEYYSQLYKVRFDECPDSPVYQAFNGWVVHEGDIKHIEDYSCVIDGCTPMGYPIYEMLLHNLLYKEVNNNTMDLKEKFVLAVTPEPQKSFRKAEITDGDNLLTQDGQKIFLTWLLGKYADEFKTAVVDGLLKKEEK